MNNNFFKSKEFKIASKEELKDTKINEKKIFMTSTKEKSNNKHTLWMCFLVCDTALRFTSSS